ncbi:hypothetical protein K4749_39315 [Streptomyces sp. TRM72054]|uniref:HAAS signaling domain-containing protein n=1 Tax=Streptomyces sp. TRM72054 TaxID=2870562 RepID=UPI001C8C8AA0|nr:hypothetical protein [Streptomyces sp. TRM72054]MBX9399432.1 hypothetical protein [Streptomyces sp. TRM72054]
MTTTDHPLVRNYLAAVAREATGLAPERRNELLADLTEHIAVALAGQTTPSEGEVKKVLGHLGDPRTIAATAQGEEPPTPPASQGRTLAPLILLPLAAPLTAVNALLGGIALIAGIALLWTTPQWRTRDKVTGTVAALLVPVTIVLVGLVAATGDRVNIWLPFGIASAAMLIPAAVCTYLYRTQRTS